MFLLERDDAQEEEREPQAGGGTNDAHYLNQHLSNQTGRKGDTIVTLGTDMAGRVDDLALVLHTD